MSISRWMDKEAVVHIHNGLLLSYKKEFIWVNSNEVDETGAYYTEWSKSERETPISSVQSLSCVWLFVTSWTAAPQASPSITNSWSLLKLMSIESVMPSDHLILCHPLLLPPSIFFRIRGFSNESVLRIRWSFSISPSNEYSGLISFMMDWLDLLAVQGTLESSQTPQFKIISSSTFSFFPTLTSIHDYWKNDRFD